MDTSNSKYAEFNRLLNKGDLSEFATFIDGLDQKEAKGLISGIAFTERLNDIVESEYHWSHTNAFRFWEENRLKALIACAKKMNNGSYYITRLLLNNKCVEVSSQMAKALIDCVTDDKSLEKISLSSKEHLSDEVKVFAALKRKDYATMVKLMPWYDKIPEESSCYNKQMAIADQIIRNLSPPIFNSEECIRKDVNEFKRGLDRIKDDEAIFRVMQKYDECLREAEEKMQNSTSDGIRRQNSYFIYILQSVIPLEYILKKTKHPPTLVLLIKMNISEAYKIIAGVSETSALEYIAENMKSTDEDIARFALGLIRCRKEDHEFGKTGGFQSQCIHCGISMDLALDLEYQ